MKKEILLTFKSKTQAKMVVLDFSCGIISEYYISNDFNFAADGTLGWNLRRSKPSGDSRRCSSSC